jgi:hypothetical protein
MIYSNDNGPWWDHEEEAEPSLGLFHALAALMGLVAALLLLLVPVGVVLLIWELLT